MNTEVTWDDLVLKRLDIITELSELFDVKEDYITYNLEFYRAVKTNNKYQAIRALDQAEQRIKDLTTKP